MPPRFFAPIVSLLAVILLSAGLQAQVTPVPNTGCPGANPPTFTGVPKINTTFGFSAGLCNTLSGAPAYTIGVVKPFTFPAPPSCSPGCVLGCNPLIVVFSAGSQGPIPNNASLVGTEFCLQTACIESGPTCISMQLAHTVRIQS